MAELQNDSGALRFALTLVSRETFAAGPGASAAEGPPGRLLATAGLEYLDQRDGEWWPLLRLPALYLAGAAVEGLLSELAAVVGGAGSGFAWRPAEDAAFAVQVGMDAGGAILEVGLDLGAFLADAAGVERRAQAELALFRFRAVQADLVRFADALGRELEVVGR